MFGKKDTEVKINAENCPNTLRTSTPMQTVQTNAKGRKKTNNFERMEFSCPRVPKFSATNINDLETNGDSGHEKNRRMLRDFMGSMCVGCSFKGPMSVGVTSSMSPVGDVLDTVNWVPVSGGASPESTVNTPQPDLNS